MFQNIIYLQGSDFKSIKVDNIRDLNQKFLNRLLSIKKDLLF